MFIMCFRKWDYCWFVFKKFFLLSYSLEKIYLEMGWKYFWLLREKIIRFLNMYVIFYNVIDKIKRDIRCFMCNWKKYNF